MKKNSQTKAASAARTELDLPDTVTVAMGDLAEKMREGLLALAVGAGYSGPAHDTPPSQPVAVPDLDRLGDVAASIHQIDADEFGHEYFPWYEDEMTTPPPLTRRRGLWELAIELWRTALPAYRPTFIHRDFHPGNLL